MLPFNISGLNKYKETDQKLNIINKYITILLATASNDLKIIDKSIK